MTFPINITVNIEAIHIALPEEMLGELVAHPTQKLLDRFATSGKSTEATIDDIVAECVAAERAVKPKKSRRKSSPENDADMLAQAQALVATPASVAEHVDADIVTPTAEPPHDENGVVIPLISATAPELAQLRDGLREIGKEAADDALEFLSDETGRRIERLGQLTVTEVKSLLVKIDNWKRFEQ